MSKTDDRITVLSTGHLTKATMALLMAMMAQPAISADESRDTSSSENTSVLEEILVTGTRIKRSGYAMPTPTTVLSGEDIAASGVTNIADLVRELPALGVGISENVESTINGTTGLNLLDLRSLGEDRTLVLVNGRRQVSSVPGSSQVDINTIPVALVERVEVMTGGASAVYGADAIAGVINFILKDDFEGVEVDGTIGAFGEGDGVSGNVAISAGKNFNDDRGNVWLSATYDNVNEVEGRDRARVRRQSLFRANMDPSGASRVLYDNVRFSIVNPSGLIYLAPGIPDGSSAFDEDGNWVPFDPGENIDGVTAMGGDGLSLANSIQLQPETERKLLAGGLNYQMSDDVNFFLEGKYSNIDSTGYAQATLNIFDMLIWADNAFLPADLAQHLADNGAPYILLNRYNEDLGNQTFSRDATSYSVNVGFEGHAFGDFDFEAYYQYGKTTADDSHYNIQATENFNNAVDAVFDANGAIVCRNPAARAAGCVPLNVIGINRMSQEARDYVNVVLEGDTKLELHNAAVSISGDLLSLPAGPLSVAAGIEWREESSSYAPNEIAMDGTTPLSTASIVKGSYDVKELFVEARAPLVADAALAKELNFETAYRLSSYSTVGTASAWKLGGDWVPVEGLRFRTTLAQSSRAPNIDELFAPALRGEQFVTDPCHETNRSLGPTPEQREMNCLALGLPSDFQSDANFKSVFVTTTGNEDLSEEDAKTTTFGVVLNPSFAPNLQMAIDYWDVEVIDAISPLNASSVLAGCVDSAGNEKLCALVERNSEGQIENVTTKVLNISTLEARGIDFEASYAVDLADDWGIGSDSGLVTFRLLGTYLDELNSLLSDFDEAGAIEQAGRLNNPEWLANFETRYQFNKLDVNWAMRYVGKTRNGVKPEDVDPFYSSSRLYHDLYVGYEVRENVIVSAGVNNLFDTEAPRSVSFQSAGHYDTKGRYFYLGVSSRF